VLNDGLRDYQIGFFRLMVYDRATGTYRGDIQDDNHQPGSTIVVKPWQTYTFHGSATLPAGQYKAYAATSADAITDSRFVNFDVYPSPGHLAVSRSLTFARTGSTPDSPVEARFAVTNDGGAPIDVSPLFVGARDANNNHVDFPAMARFTLAPGESRECAEQRALPSGTYLAWPTEEIDANTYPQLEPPRSYPIP
jgi:hypothetical protein